MAIVSIVVPIYCVEHYLIQCIESILLQSFFDYELILVDDGSFDQCGKICDEYINKNKKIQVLHKNNEGLSYARNSGLELAQGKFILFVDSDDYIEPMLLKCVYKKILEGYDQVIFSFREIKDNLIRETIYKEADKAIDFYDEFDCLKLFIQVFFDYGIGWSAWSRLYNRDIIERYHIRFANNKEIFAEDIYFNLCYLVHTNSIYIMSDVLYNYRIRDDSIMGVDIHKSNLNRFHLLAEKVYEYYLTQNLMYYVQHFSVMYYMIIQYALHSELNSFYFEIEDYLLLEKKIDNQKFMRNQLKRLKYEKSLLLLKYSSRQVMSILNSIQYLLDHNYIKFKIKRKLISHLNRL